MTELQRLAQLANQLHEDEPSFPTPVPWHARNTLWLEELAYDLCPCGKGFTDNASRKQHQT